MERVTLNINTMVNLNLIRAVSLDRISTGTGLNSGGQPSNRQRDRIGKTRSLFVRQRDRVDPVRLTVNVTGSIIADRGITAGEVRIKSSFNFPS